MTDLTNLTEMEVYKIYKTLSPRALPKPDSKAELADPMVAAELAEAGGELAFLTAPPARPGALPAGLLDRALALGPRVRKRPSPWRQALAALAALVTFLAFGSGSYALANGLSVQTSLNDPFTADQAGLFETATDSGFFAYE